MPSKLRASAKGANNRRKTQKKKKIEVDLQAMLASSKQKQEQGQQDTLEFAKYVQNYHENYKKEASKHTKIGHKQIVHRMRDHLAEEQVAKREQLAEEEKLMQRYVAVQQVLAEAQDILEASQPVNPSPLEERRPFRMGSAKEPIYDPSLPHEFQRSDDYHDEYNDNYDDYEYNQEYDDEEYLEELELQEEFLELESEDKDTQESNSQQQDDVSLSTWERLSGVKTSTTAQSPSSASKKSSLKKTKSSDEQQELDQRVLLAQQAAKERLRERKQKERKKKAEAEAKKMKEAEEKAKRKPKVESAWKTNSSVKSRGIKPKERVNKTEPKKLEKETKQKETKKQTVESTVEQTVQEPVKETSAITCEPAPSSIVRALYEFEPVEEDDLHIYTGDIITNVSALDDEWLQGSLNGITGVFPRNFVVPFDMKDESSAGSQLKTMTMSFSTDSDTSSDVVPVDIPNKQFVTLTAKQTIPSFKFDYIAVDKEHILYAFFVDEENHAYWCLGADGQCGYTEAKNVREFQQEQTQTGQDVSSSSLAGPSNNSKGQKSSTSAAAASELDQLFSHSSMTAVHEIIDVHIPELNTLLHLETPLAQHIEPLCEYLETLVSTYTQLKGTKSIVKALPILLDDSIEAAFLQYLHRLPDVLSSIADGLVTANLDSSVEAQTRSALNKLSRDIVTLLMVPIARLLTLCRIFNQNDDRLAHLDLTDYREIMANLTREVTKSMESLARYIGLFQCQYAIHSMPFNLLHESQRRLVIKDATQKAWTSLEQGADEPVAHSSPFFVFLFTDCLVLTVFLKVNQMVSFQSYAFNSRFDLDGKSSNVRSIVFTTEMGSVIKGSPPHMLELSSSGGDHKINLSFAEKHEKEKWIAAISKCIHMQTEIVLEG
eukprot:TRINITY_DN2508_c0_g1_i4.p1 TRINITY_DN2508_c0_g1~~TRINITY_DN2508_c0_g1_i4.p1  ORF type:complete len:886 (-),score=320.30 TRINITY_DN2508_c0_g1_i4:245-2902(-)